MGDLRTNLLNKVYIFYVSPFATFNQSAQTEQDRNLSRVEAWRARNKTLKTVEPGARNADATQPPKVRERRDFLASNVGNFFVTSIRAKWLFASQRGGRAGKTKVCSYQFGKGRDFPLLVHDGGYEIGTVATHE